MIYIYDSTNFISNNETETVHHNTEQYCNIKKKPCKIHLENVHTNLKKK